PDDMKQAGLRQNTPVSLVSSAGRLDNLRVQPFDVRRGNLMTYFPEANVLVPREVDPRSRTPAFKSVPVILLGPPASRILYRIRPVELLMSPHYVLINRSPKH